MSQKLNKPTSHCKLQINQINNKATPILLLALLVQIPTVNAERDFSKGTAWGYAMIATCILGAIGFTCSGVIFYLIILLITSLFRPILQVLIAFAAGALLGDAFVHLIPEGLGAHQHEEEKSEKKESNPPSALLSLMIIVGMVIFYIIERIMGIFGLSHNHEDEEDGSCQKDKLKNQEENTSLNQCDSKPSKENLKMEDEQKIDQQVNEVQDQQEEALANKKPNNGTISSKVTPLDIEQTSNAVAPVQAEMQNSDDIVSDEKIVKKSWIESWKNKNSEGYLNLVGDFFHNIIDGIALGAIFSTGNTSNSISTFVAIVAHEIPQEIGDVGILLNSKFTNLQALICNGLVNFSALLGAIIGLALGELNSKSEKYLSLIIAGNFIYIGACDMFPILRKETKLKIVLLQLIALAMGFGVMFLVLLSEKEEDEHSEHSDHEEENH